LAKLKPKNRVAQFFSGHGVYIFNTVPSSYPVFIFKILFSDMFSFVLLDIFDGC